VVFVLAVEVVAPVALRAVTGLAIHGLAVFVVSAEVRHGVSLGAWC